MVKARILRTALFAFALVFIASCGQQTETKNDSAGEETTTEESSANQDGQEADEAKLETKTKIVEEKPAEPAKPKEIFVDIPAGMNIVIALSDTLETGKVNTGDEFTGTLVDSIAIAGKIIFPAGTMVTGKILNAVGSGRLKTDAELSLTLQSIADTEIQTDIIEDKASSHADRNKKLIGGGALVGGILGALKGKDVKGALAGAAAGAAAGTGAAALTGKKNLRYDAGMLLQFTLAESARAKVSK